MKKKSILLQMSNDEKVIITKAVSSDLPKILEVQKQAFYSEAVFYNDFNIQPMRQTLEEISEEFKNKVFLKASIDGRIVGSVRASRSLENEKTCFIEKLFPKLKILKSNQILKKNFFFWISPSQKEVLLQCS